jgi:hypothetical protein
MNPIKKQPDMTGHNLHLHTTIITLPWRSDSELLHDRSESVGNDGNELKLNELLISEANGRSRPVQGELGASFYQADYNTLT